MKAHLLSLALLIASNIPPANAQATHTALRAKLHRIAQTTHGIVGIAITNLATGDTLTLNDHHHFPMQSTYKFPLAMTVLHQVDLGHLSLTQTIHVTQADLYPTYSPIRDKYPNGNVNVTIADLLRYTVSQSDNNACDLLFKTLGGPAPVNQYIHSLGIPDIRIKTTEHQAATAWSVQYTNWCRPSAMRQLLTILHKNSALSKTSNAFLWQLLLQTSTGPNRLKGLLPPHTIVAHKTGTSDTNDKGLTAAVNDVGIIELPNGQPLAIAVYISNATAPLKTLESAIAQIAKAVWEDATK